MKNKLYNILAICIGILPINIAMIWHRLTHENSFTTSDMLVYPLLIGGGNVALILILNKYLLKENISAFSRGKGKWFWDILTGIALTAVYFLLLFAERAVIAELLPPGKPPSEEIIRLMIDLANNKVLLAVWLGPVVWIGVALFEELSRAFFYNCLWNLSKNKFWIIFTIIFVAVVWGFAHLYQGAFGIISVSIQGLIMGIFYYKFRRILPLIISHALYDSIQIVLFVIQVS